MRNLAVHTRTIVVVGLMAFFYGCAGSPIQLSSMNEEELKSQDVFALCNAFNFNRDAEVKNELQRRGALTDEEWGLVESETIAVGMSELALICLRGAIVPGYGTVNVTSGSWGTQKQYVYVSALGGRSYVYVENGKVRSWQY
jgi:hypothetical protein